MNAGKLTPDEAMQELDHLTLHQAEGITKGLARQQVMQIFNSAQLPALQNFQKQGLTPNHLRGKDWFNDASHVGALGYLLNTRKLTSDEAMQELDHLAYYQAEYIAKGFTRQQVQGLNNDLIHDLH